MLNGPNSSSPSSNLVEKKTSYCFNTMARIETMKKAIVQTEQLVNKTKESVEIELNKMLKNGNVAFELQKLKIKIRMLREQLDEERADLDRLKRINQSFNKSTTVNHTIGQTSSVGHLSSINQSTNTSHSMCNNVSNNLSNNWSNKQPNSLPVNLHHPHQSSSLSTNQSSNLPNNINSSTTFSHQDSTAKEETVQPVAFDADGLERDRKLLNTFENEIAFKRDLLNQLNESLWFTERRLISELYEIFPINESQEAGRFTILGLQLPDLTDPLDENDVQIKIGLGYCCQLLITISKVFDLPLKHTILFSGSQSWIVNETENPKLKDKKYPLFHNRDKTKFNIAIYLLNENVAQLRHHFNLNTNDHKKLSANLFSLFNDKLLLKDETDENGHHRKSI